MWDIEGAPPRNDVQAGQDRCHIGLALSCSLSLSDRGSDYETASALGRANRLLAITLHRG